MKSILNSTFLSVALLLSAVVTFAPASPVAALEELQPFTPISPMRVLDTRNGIGAPTQPVGPGETITLDLSGVDQMPDRTQAVIINVTTTRSSGPSFVTVWASDAEQPETSNLNTEPGQDTPNLALVRVGNDLAINLYNAAGTVHLVADITAYVGVGFSIRTTQPSRILDSRDGTGTNQAPFGPGETRTLQVAGVGAVEADARAVVLNITSTKSTEASYLTVWPSGQDRPLASTLNTEPGQNTPNLAIVELGVDGALDIYNDTGSTDMIADVVGFLEPSSMLKTGTPKRVLDTRAGLGTAGARTPLGPDQQIDLAIGGLGDVPANATAVVVNITSVASSAASYVSVWPTGSPQPIASTLNTEVGQATPNLAFVKLGDGGKISLFNKFGTTHLIADVAGWYLPPSTQPIVDELDFFRGEGFRSTANFGLSRASAWSWNPTTRVIEASTAAGVFATGENFHSYARLYTSFQARRIDADLSYDIEWNGTMTSFVGADSDAEVWITIRVYELIPNSSGGPATRSTVIWDREIENTGVGAALQAIAVDQVVGDEQRTVRLPDLDVGGIYRVEAEVYCKTRVIFSIGATACDFETGDRGVKVNDWTLEYEPTT